MADFKSLDGYEVKDATARDGISALDTRVTALEQSSSFPSHIGMIVESTTLDTEAKVKALYGNNTSWIQHTGYMLRGANSGVSSGAGHNVSDGGNDNAIIPYHNHTVPSGGQHSHMVGCPNAAHPLGLFYSEGTMQYTNPRIVFAIKPERVNEGKSYGGAPFNAVSGNYSGFNDAHSHTINYSGEDVTNKNIPKYKSVYIWERVS